MLLLCWIHNEEMLEYQKALPIFLYQNQKQHQIILFFKLSKIVGFFLNTIDFKYSQKQKSNVFKIGDKSVYFKYPLLLIHLTENINTF